MESFSGSLNNTFDSYISIGTENISQFKFGFSEGKISSIINSNGKSNNIKTPKDLSHLIFYKNPLIKCFNKCSLTLSFKLERIHQGNNNFGIGFKYRD